MRSTKVCAICTLTAMAVSMTMGAAANAQENTIAVPYEQEGAWDELAVTNDDMVSTGINIRSAADEDSQVIGYLYHGGAAWVLDRTEEWTEVYSGGITGFVKNEYLVYGEDAQNMAELHGVEGVATTWDDVKLYEQEDGGSEVLDSLEYGDSFILTQDNGHWLQVQRGADDVAYVSAEDVSRVLLLDTAVATEAAQASSETYTDGYSADSYTYDAYEEDSYTETYTDTYTETYTDNSADTYTETADTSGSETYTDTQTDTSGSETYTDTSADEDTYYDADSDTMVYGSYDSSADTSSSDTSSGTATESYYDPETGIYYDASTGLYYDSGTGILYDAWWNPVNEAIATTPQTDSSSQSDTTTEQTEAYTEQTESYTEETESSSSAGTDDTSLLAALIYCEAGNQSYEGMVAVGAVVMNRVYSSSFPNTISEVIYQSGQFTPASSGALASALANGVPSACYDAAAAAISGENPVGGALYFNTGSGKGMKIGDHQFY